MFKRVMVAVVGLPLLILILGWAPSWATMLLLAAMCAIGAWELMRAAAGERGKPLTPLTVIAAAAVPVCVYGEMSIENTELTALPVLPFAALLGAVFIFAIFALAIHRYDEEQGIPFAAVTCAIFAGLAFPLMFSCLLRLRMMPAIGMLQVFLPLAISFGSDTFALFAGMLCGKHKLAPKVSPKMTVEGAIGGLLGGVIGGILVSRDGQHGTHPDCLSANRDGSWSADLLGGSLCTGYYRQHHQPDRRPEFLRHQAGVRRQGLWQPAAGPWRHPGPV